MSPDPYVIMPADSYDGARAAEFDFTVLPGAGNVSGHPAPPGVNGYRALVSNGAPHFRVFGPLGGTPCGKRVKTSVTASAHNCHRFRTQLSPLLHTTVTASTHNCRRLRTQLSANRGRKAGPAAPVQQSKRSKQASPSEGKTRSACTET